jgi:hypothetical protein
MRTLLLADEGSEQGLSPSYMQAGGGRSGPRWKAFGRRTASEGVVEQFRAAAAKAAFAGRANRVGEEHSEQQEKFVDCWPKG